MQRFLVGQPDDEIGLDEILIILALNEQEAIIKYQLNLEPSDTFLEHLHERFGFGETFYYDEESEGQNHLPETEINKKIIEYFKEKPEFAEIYKQHWNDEIQADQTEFLMATFPEDMIDWIWRKELMQSNWTRFIAINLDKIEVL